jgi:hypothetical protein
MSALLQGIFVAAFSIILTAILAYLHRLNERMGEFAISIKELQTQMSPFWAIVQAKISKDLHHPSVRYAEMDGLLEKLEALTITLDERERLKALLVERSTDRHEDITDDQRMKAGLMIPLMELVVDEAKGKT